MRTPTKLILLAVLLLPLSLHAQITFERTYGGIYGDWGYSVQQTPDGGCIVVGCTYSYGAGGGDVYLIKTDSVGDTLWTRTFGDTGYDEGYSVQQTTDSGYVITGSKSAGGSRRPDVYLIKTDVNSETLWTRTFGGEFDDQGYSVRQTTDGGYIIAGETDSYGAGGFDVYLVKTGSNGDTLWTRTYGGTRDDRGYSVQQTADDGYIVAGWTWSFGAGYEDVYLIKTDAEGDTAWTRTYGGADCDWGRSVELTSDHGFVVAGFTQSFGAGGFDIYLIRADSLGDTLWTRTFGGTGDEDGRAVELTANGGTVIAGYTASFGAGRYDVYLIRTGAGGDTMWTRTLGGDSDDIGRSVQPAAGGGFTVAGETYSFGAGRGDIYLVKTDSLGNVAVAEPKASPVPKQGISLTCEPNPTTGRTTIRLSPFAFRHSPPNLRVFDSQGRLVHLALGIRASSFRLDLRSLPAGAYFLRLDAGNQHATARLVLQR